MKAKPRILVVEDDPDFRDTITSGLRDQGFEVEEAENGTTALERVQPEVAVVVTDIRMPGGDGLTLLDRLRSLPRSRPRVILMTGFADLSDEEALRRGASAVIAKPFPMKQLLTLVQCLVNDGV